MRAYLIVILIGLVAGFIGILPLLRQKTDKYSGFAAFLFYALMPYVVYHISVPGVPAWWKGIAVTLVLSLPVIIAISRSYKRCIFPMLLMSVLVGFFITFLGRYLL